MCQLRAKLQSAKQWQTDTWIKPITIVKLRWNKCMTNLSKITWEEQLHLCKYPELKVLASFISLSNLKVMLKITPWFLAKDFFYTTLKGPRSSATLHKLGVLWFKSAVSCLLSIQTVVGQRCKHLKQQWHNRLYLLYQESEERIQVNEDNGNVL